MSLNKILQGFETITLKELESRMALMKRQESKYLTTKAGLANILEKLKKDYYLLEINNIRLFLYDNMYMDNKGLVFYHDHENNKQARVKLRKRKYVDSKKTFVEYKVKTASMMDKKRMKLDNNLLKKMDKKSREFFKELYGKSDMYVLPTMQTTYQRITLCNKKTEERLTIDLNLVFSDPKDQGSTPRKVKDFVIIEVKQKQGSRSKVCKNIIESNGGELAEGCSKYCLGLIYFGKVQKFTHFQKTVDFIEDHGGVRKIRRKRRK